MTYEEAALEIGKLVKEKNSAYGNSFKDSATFLKLLFPNGIPTDKYQDILLIVRVFDKLKRLANRKDAFGESPWQDITGYGLLGVVNDSKENGQVRGLGFTGWYVKWCNDCHCMRQGQHPDHKY